ncbi:MAG: GDP-mannose 4,6-dehydratase, partial [Planctomycetes bacterium]|nr:GDP-mannose 4,6-dehydratase [Planctomycetota bacterium]
MKVLITGGAGFIGSHLADALVSKGASVRAFDNLDPQIHENQSGPPDYMNPDVEFIRGDILDAEALENALDGVDVVVHYAAAVGVGQSMYEIAHYTRVNALGAATLLDILVKGKRKLKKLIVASSMSIYGEGLYVDSAGKPVSFTKRPALQLEKGDFAVRSPETGEELRAVATPETKPLAPPSIYAIGKRDHEEMFLSVGRAYDVPTVALRYFNAFGPRQALSNPYTGVTAIFGGRLLNGKPPVIYEDGTQSRDFIHVSDIVGATLTAIDNPAADYEVFNVGLGRGISIKEVAEVMIRELGIEGKVAPEITGQFRRGDIKHCFADTTKIRERIGFTPALTFEEGARELIKWMRT